MFQLIVGLGNPGLEYAYTRHNIAWLFFNSLPFHDSLIWKGKFKGLYSETLLSNQKVYFVKPQTFMNLSGESVRAMATFFKILPSGILVLHDELDLPFGQVHFKMGGGLAGHNGLKSIAQHLGTVEFARLRIGIGRPEHGSVADYVLAPFSSPDKAQLDRLFQKIHDPFQLCVVEGLNKVVNCNKKNFLS